MYNNNTDNSFRQLVQIIKTSWTFMQFWTWIIVVNSLTWIICCTRKWRNWFRWIARCSRLVRKRAPATFRWLLILFQLDWKWQSSGSCIIHNFWNISLLYCFTKRAVLCLILLSGTNPNFILNLQTLQSG